MPSFGELLSTYMARTGISDSELARTLGSPARVIDSLQSLSLIEAFSGELEHAAELIEEALTLQTTAGVSLNPLVPYALVWWSIVVDISTGQCPRTRRHWSCSAPPETGSGSPTWSFTWGISSVTGANLSALSITMERPSACGGI